jgi:hypothetical protein
LFIADGRCCTFSKPGVDLRGIVIPIFFSFLFVDLGEASHLEAKCGVSKKMAKTG